MTHVGISFSVGIIDMMFQALSHKTYIRVFVFVVVAVFMSIAFHVVFNRCCL